MRKGLVVLVMVAVICIAGQVHGQITCTGTVFNDVNSTTQPSFCGWIEWFSDLGITSGCAVNPPLYCPDDFVTRGQMAVFVTKATAVPFQKNPQQIALLKWYDAGRAAAFPVGGTTTHRWRSTGSQQADEEREGLTKVILPLYYST